MFSGPLARKFASLALLIVLPLWAISTYLLVVSLDELQTLAKAEVLRLAQLSSMAIDRWYQDQIGDMEIMARMPQFERGATPEAYDMLREIQAIRPQWHGVSLIDRHGKLLLYSIRPYGASLPSLQDVPAVMRAIREKRPTLSQVYLTRVDQVPGVALEVPILRRGRVLGVIGTVYVASDLAQLFTKLRLPTAGHVELFDRTGSVLLVLDPAGQVVFRSRDPERWIGREARGFVDRVAPPGKTEGVIQARGLDGVERIYGYHVAADTGWRILVGIPASVASSVRWRLLPPSLLLDLVAMLLTLGLVILMARRFTQPALALRDAAIAFGEGDHAARVAHPPADEIGDVGRAFNRMADQIEASQANLEQLVRDRTTQLETANEALETSNAQMVLANRQLSATVDDLKRLEQQRAEFLNMTSHDLRIPLTAIRGYAEFLEEGTGGTLSPQQQEFVRSMLASVERMTHLLEELLDFARVEAGQLKLDCQPLDLTELINDSIEPLEVLAKRKHQELVCHLPTGLPLVTADPSRIQQVVTNFLSNAIKYTPEHGRIEVRLEARDGMLRTSVTDTGIGISEADRRELFKRFFRARNAEGIPGTGLGLSIAKGIVEAHGGRVGVESQLGIGSTFWFELPVTSDEPAASGTGSGPAG